MAAVLLVGANGQDLPAGFRLQNTKFLGPKMLLSWGTDSNDLSALYFQVEAEAHGWVGVGFNNKGAMGGADMVIGWVDGNGKATFEDRFGVADTSAPVKDTVQNAKLLKAYENATHTVLIWSRPANTNDKAQDFVLSGAPINVLWAYTDTDPAPGGKVGYHDARGHVGSTVILNAATQVPGNNNKKPSGASNLTRPRPPPLKRTNNANARANNNNRPALLRNNPTKRN
jgi:hypothetical protein